MTDDKLRAALEDLFPPVERARWPFTVEQATNALRAALAASATDEGLAALDEDSRKHIHDLLATVAFLRSVVASGELLNADDEERMRGVYESAREYAALRSEDPKG